MRLIEGSALWAARFSPRRHIGSLASGPSPSQAWQLVRSRAVGTATPKTCQTQKQNRGISRPREQAETEAEAEVRLADIQLQRDKIQLQRDEMKFEMLRESIKDNVSDELREFLRRHNFEDLLTRLYKKLGVRTLACLDLITTEQV